MTSIFNDAIRLEKTPIRVVDRRPSVRHPPDAPPEVPAGGGVLLTQHDGRFSEVVGPEPRHALVVSSAETSRNPFFHAGCAWLVERSGAGGGTGGSGFTEVVYATSDLLQPTSSAQLPVVLISRVVLRRGDTGDIVAAEWSKLRPPAAMPMPAGAIPYGPSTAPGFDTPGGVLYCAQGSPSPGTSGLFYMPRFKKPQPLVTGYYGRDFNSVYDVARNSRDGSLWFTDPCQGYELDFRKKPQLPCHVYRFDPDTGGLRVVADCLRQPTGICFSPDGLTLYVTDTDAVHGSSSQDTTRAATIYAFSVLQRDDSDFLVDRRVFAYALHGVPVGIKCDDDGNVYAACGDGVEVWNAGGTLLGVIEVPGGATSLCFGVEGEMFVCAEQHLWYMKFSPGEEASPQAAVMLVDTEHGALP